MVKFPEWNFRRLNEIERAALRSLIRECGTKIDLSSLPPTGKAGRLWRMCGWYAQRGLLDIRPYPDMSSNHYIAELTTRGRREIRFYGEETGNDPATPNKEHFGKVRRRQMAKSARRALSRKRSQ